MKWYIIIVSFIIAGCSSAYHFKSKGQFNGSVERDQNVFVTVIDKDGNNIPKITDGLLSYFAWKTVKYNYRVDSSTAFSTYRTLVNDASVELSPDEAAYLKVTKRLLNNYLFFLDDYRFYYLSEDDNRSKESFGLLPLYFEKKNYPIQKEIYGNGLDQLSRGYYHLEGDQLFLDFEDVRHFYVKATYDSVQQTISFDSIAIPEKNVLTQSGINNIYVSFDQMLNRIAQPVFELPRDDDQIPDQDFILTSGWSVSTPKRTHPLDSTLNAEYPEWKKATFDIIHKISYSYPENGIFRNYEIEVMDGMQPKIITVSENARELVTW